MDYKYRVCRSGVVVIERYIGTATKVVVPGIIDGKIVNALDDHCFYKTGITEIELPEGIKWLGSHCFAGTPIEEIELPDTITKIRFSCFSGCEYLKRVKLSKNLERLTCFAFAGCPKLEEINGLDNIDRFDLYYAFRKVGVNTAVTFPRTR